MNMIVDSVSAIEWQLRSWRFVNDRLPRVGPRKWPEGGPWKSVSALPLLSLWDITHRNNANKECT